MIATKRKTKLPKKNVQWKSFSFFLFLGYSFSFTLFFVVVVAFVSAFVDVLVTCAEWCWVWEGWWWYQNNMLSGKLNYKERKLLEKRKERERKWRKVFRFGSFLKAKSLSYVFSYDVLINPSVAKYLERQCLCIYSFL